MRLTMENKQERDHAHCAGSQRKGVDVEPHPPHTWSVECIYRDINFGFSFEGGFVASQPR